MHILAKKVDETLQNRLLGVPCKGSSRIHVSKYGQDLDFFATLEGTEIGKWGKVILCFHRSGNSEVRRSGAWKCLIVKLLSKIVAAGNAR